MTLLHSASKGHLISAFPYGQDLLLRIAITLLLRLKTDNWLTASSPLAPFLLALHYRTELFDTVDAHFIKPEGSQLN